MHIIILLLFAGTSRPGTLRPFKFKICINVFSINKNIKMSSIKSSENIQKKEGGPDRSVSDNQSSSVNLNEVAMKARKHTVISSFSKEVIHCLTLIEMGSK